MPAIKIGRLAIDKKYSGQGLGSDILMNILFNIKNITSIMKLNYVVRQSKVRKNGLAPVELSIIINNDRKVISLDRQINPKHWNPKSQTVRNNPEINTYLQAITQKAYNTQTEMLQLGMTFNINTFIEAFKNGVTPSISLLNIYKQHNKQYEQQIFT